ncbi:hypothetical protein PENTCL1PPCAC_9224 [Pristionchus entomophagus]|uniref:Uncharacterized protein n=1 Tax=Pristionchus entomophagus TaxID=358040 RepID=A0AAV5SVX0_9BILA|nr:hypothetical protein PENTCL1PPCAC_9224 [Pristionchus entomophagus]
MMGRWFVGLSSPRYDGHKCIVHEFWIYKLGPEGTDSSGKPQYEYTILSTCTKSPVTVLVSNPGKFKQIYKEAILSWLKENQFTTGGAYPLVQPDYSTCYYTDSITQIMGY